MSSNPPGPLAALLPHGATSPADAREVEDLGYRTLWVSQSPPADLVHVESLLAATNSLVVGTDIVNVFTAPAATVAESFHRIEAAHPGRLILGIGVGHSEHLSQYRRPVAMLASYLDELTGAGVPKERMALAALGPRVLGLARDRTGGALPYFVTPEHTERAREILGDHAFLSVGQSVVLDADPVRARELAAPTANVYLGLRNYTANLRRLGFAEQDLAVPAADHLIDSIIAHGGVEEVTSRLREHLSNGADQVAVAVLARDASPLPALRALAREFTTTV
ncbi:TIGR03620 family F420-dependent LLM class oxidoreductase [Gordonia alkanivorans]|uniref:Luciferase-like domain-containing protein n=1 Tax=Gordonia alkanivorans NBRC 16433 TaxID=1027371 RepID=F9W245_9ACTN|nr:TIGR03620 family F420-dependent LLM class oxidoreductase [Gordonia alkanivorans]GAA14905.1 hypothetical protein GOALK_118_00230 [Gordonia alkanivorans NBRC 16433]